MDTEEESTANEPSLQSDGGDGCTSAIVPAAVPETGPPKQPSVSSGVVRLSNGMVGKAFRVNIDLATYGLGTLTDVDADLGARLEHLGLEGSVDGKTLTLSGTPVREGDYEINLPHAPDGADRQHHTTFSWFVNADPRSLWKSLEPDPSLGYRKDHTATRHLAGTGFQAIAASRRGRAHAHEGKFREDDYTIASMNDWMIVAVGDGAGSAKFSREGSRLATGKAVESLLESIPAILTGDFDAAVLALADGDETAQKTVRNCLYKTLCGAAFDAYKSIERLATSAPHPIKDYATTLLLAICRSYNARTFVATFWIGDGAIGLLRDEGRKATLMGMPDGGEFSGQTRFLTMSEILGDSHEMLRRVEFAIESDVTAVMLMTDGVSDPKFGTDNELLSSTAWAKLWLEMAGDVQIASATEAEQRLLGWMDFWSPGEHDDRTLVVVCRQDRN